MKKLIVFLYYIYLLFPLILLSNDEPTMCPMDMSQFQQDTIPNYLQPWWGGIRIGKFAVLYVDFPDGRYINGNDTLQPFYDSQLEWVFSHGEPDAAGEIGLINEQTNIPVGDKYMKASKYNWYDRWNMFFDSLGVYYGTAHPDFASHGDSAWGSFKQYWKEASNGKFEVIPYVTHPNESNYKFKTGIINDYQMVNGVPVIKCMKLPKKKYGTLNQNSYLRGFSNNDSLEDAAMSMMDDAQRQIRSQTSFNLDQFYAEGGVLFIYFAGSHGGLKDIGVYNLVPGPRVSVVRLREEAITDIRSKIDGFGVSAHQYGHAQFGWFHTNSGRCDIMNGGDVHDNNSPQFPNPVYRMKEGWLQPIAMGSTQQIDTLPPIETSHKCGVITIYGKPSAAADWSTGESFVIENRRRLNFDRSLVDRSILPENPNFKGGLLIWHYSPYTQISSYRGAEPYIKFCSADTNSNLFQNRGNPTSFFAFDADLGLKIFDSSKTYSGVNLKTGIELKTIEQNNYSDLNSTIKFNLNYLISEPPNYSYVVFPKGEQNSKINLSGNVFYHKDDPNKFYNILPGTQLDAVRNISFNSTINCNMEAKGTPNNFITFKNPGYSNANESYVTKFFRSIAMLNTPRYSDIDSSILENVNILGADNAIVKELDFNSITIPGKLKNINVTPNFGHATDYDIAIRNCTHLSEISLQNMQVQCYENNYYEGIDLESCRASFTYNNYFGEGKSVILDNTLTDNKNGTFPTSFLFDNISGSGRWGGIIVNGGGITLERSAGGEYSYIRKALVGIDITGSTDEVSLRNIRFQDNENFDVSIYKPSSYSREDITIRKNVFEQTDESFIKLFSLSVSECDYISIDSNTLTNTGYFGIILLNSQSPYIDYNTITGGNLEENSTGILSYNSNGYYKCNEISQFTNYGIELDNSQPVLFNNEIYVNGLGLYLTNNSNPVMQPGYMPNHTYVLGGYNRIHHNASQEIYCNNSTYYSSTPLMYQGYNAFDDYYALADVLIYNKPVSGLAPTIYCAINYWGGGDPVSRLIPINSFVYHPYLTSTLSYTCEFLIDDEDNSEMEEEQLLFGNVLKNQYEGNYSSALNYSNQILSLTNSSVNPVISLNDLFTSTYLSNGDFTDLENYYLAFASQNQADTVLYNKAMNLAIQSKIKRNLIEPAISEYENILSTSSEEEIRFYASIDRSRAIRLLLDSLLNHGGEDNIPINMNPVELYDKAINYIVNQNPLEIKSIEKATDKSNKSIDSKENIETKNSVISKNSNRIHFSNLQSKVADKIKNFENLTKNEKRTLIIEKNVLDIAENNYLDGIAALDDKLKYLNQENNLVPKIYKLFQNYPNPFNPLTIIKFEIPNSEIVKIKIYDLLGREVLTLLNEFKEEGTYEIEFNGVNLSSGVYFYKIESGGFKQVKRMVLLK